MQFKVVSLIGGCSTAKSSMGYQFIEEGAKLSAKTAFRTFGGVSDVKAPDIKGAFYTAPDFKCRCGNTHLYQCKACGKFICYDGKAQSNAVCPACNAKNDVPAAPADGRIVCSGSSAMVRKAEIVLAIDVSSSMRGNRLETVKKAAIEQFISKYKGSCMALVTFQSHVIVAERATTNISLIENRIKSLSASGGTMPPLDLILNSFEMSYFRKSSSPRYLVIFTDGDWFGDYSTNVQNAEKIKKMGIKILTIGCDGADADFLKTISSPDCSIITDDAGIGNAFATIAKKAQQ